MIAVCNTSPLILLDRVGHIWLLEKLFQKVVIPPAVSKEWLRPGDYVLPLWLTVESLSDQARIISEKLYGKLDPGEAQAIGMSMSIKADALILDDLKARKYAQSLGLPVAGTVGLLVTAKRRGMIPELRPLLDSLKKQRLYLSDDLLRKALALAKED